MTTDTRPTVLVTGCSPGGIGHSLALEFARKNCRVFATVRKPAALANLHPNIEPVTLEVHIPSSILALKLEIESRTGGKLDYLVNNAGTQYMTTALDADVEQIEYLYNVNLFSVMRLVKAFAPLVMEAKGKIVMIGSVTRDVPVFWQGPYNASKAALSQWSNTLRLEMLPFGVQVVEIVTGFVQSNIMRDGIIAPQNSIYAPLKQIMQDFKVQGNRNGMSGDAYARSVVKQVLRKKASEEIWEGKLAGMLRFMVWAFPRWLTWLFPFSIHRKKNKADKFSEWYTTACSNCIS